MLDGQGGDFPVETDAVADALHAKRCHAVVQKLDLLHVGPVFEMSTLSGRMKGRTRAGIKEQRKKQRKKKRKRKTKKRKKRKTLAVNATEISNTPSQLTQKKREGGVR